MIADAVLLDVGMGLWLARHTFDHREGFENRARVGLAAAKVVHLAHARGFDKCRHEAGDVQGVDVVAHLLALVAEDFVFTSFEVAFDQVGQEAVQLHA